MATRGTLVAHALGDNSYKLVKSSSAGHPGFTILFFSPFPPLQPSLFLYFLHVLSPSPLSFSSSLSSSSPLLSPSSRFSFLHLPPSVPLYLTLPPVLRPEVGLHALGLVCGPSAHRLRLLLSEAASFSSPGHARVQSDTMIADLRCIREPWRECPSQEASPGHIQVSLRCHLASGCAGASVKTPLQPQCPEWDLGFQKGGE